MTAGPRLPEHDRLERDVERRVRRLRVAEDERRSVLGQMFYLGTLGLIFVLPVVGGAYLGHWLDGLAAGYSLRWTLGFIFLGLIVGAINVYLLVREQR